MLASTRGRAMVRLVKKRDTTPAIVRLGDETRAGRPRRPAAIAAGLAAAGLLDAALGLSGLAAPVVLVSGFWRSGTTWLQECLAESLGAKTVFEPLSPQEPRRRAALEPRFPGDEDALQAFIPGPFAEGAPDWRALDAACRGRHGGAFLLSCRASVAESARTAIVVKDVRLHANLAGFHRRFGVPVVHLRRHPCAVVASLLAADWHWSFARVTLARLDPAAEALRAFDTDALSRIAAYWAHVERRAALAIDGRAWGRTLAYETLAARPGPVVEDLCGWLGRPQRRTPDFGRPAASVHPDIFAARPRAPEPWRTRLSEAEVVRVEAIADAVFPAWRASLAL